MAQLYRDLNVGNALLFRGCRFKPWLATYGA